MLPLIDVSVSLCFLSSPHDYKLTKPGKTSPTRPSSPSVSLSCSWVCWVIFNGRCSAHIFQFWKITKRSIMMILFWAAKGWNAPVAILYPDKFKMKVENLREKSQLLGFLKKKKFCCIPNIFSVLWRTKVQWFNIKIPSEGPWYGPTCVTPGVTASASESISTNQRQLASISTNQHQSASINFNQYQSASIIINKNQSTSIRKKLNRRLRWNHKFVVLPVGIFRIGS